jgi:hypothetical protein
MTDKGATTGDETVGSGVLRDEQDDAFIVEQQAVGADNVKGGGEWPDPDAPAEAPAPGSDPVEAEAIAEERKVDRAKSNAEQLGQEKPADEVARVADTGEGLAGEIDTTRPLKTVLEADPVRGGSKSTPD